MSTCGQCEYYLTKMDECPHPEKRALDKACDKLQYTNPRKRIDYLQAENKKLKAVENIARIKLEAIKIRAKATPNDKGNKPIWVIAKTGLEAIESALKG